VPTFTNIPQNYTSFSAFINNIVNNDTFISLKAGKLLKTYLYYIYGNQLLYGNNYKDLQFTSLYGDYFNYSNVQVLNNTLNNISNVYDVSNIKMYLNTVSFNDFNLKNYQYNMNPHLYYSYLNLGYIENLMSLYTNSTIDLTINNYTNFNYSDIDNLRTCVLNYFEGSANIIEGNIGIVNLKKSTEYYSNIYGYSTIKNNILIYDNDTTNIILNDLLIYSNNRIYNNNQSNLQTICNMFVTDIKSLLLYFSNTLDDIQTLRHIVNNNSTIAPSQLRNSLNINGFSDFNTNNINDYNLEYFNTIQVYNSLTSYRSTYNYNDILTAYDNDVQNYLNFLLNINDTVNIGSSLKYIFEQVASYYPSSDIYKIINENKTYGEIIILNSNELKTYLSNEQTIFENYYNEYKKNIDLLDISDNIELNTIDNTIKSLNINSNQYVPSLSSIDQFNIYNRQYFGYNIDNINNIIYDIPGSITHPFFISNVSINLTNQEYYNKSILDTNIYENQIKTYDYQLKKIQSYFFNKVYDSNDSDLDYLKSSYALENYDIYRSNPIFISQLNRFNNYDISDNIVSNIINYTKIDNNFNQSDFNIQRITNNSSYYINTLKILDNLKINNTIYNNDVSYMKDFLANSVIYTNYKINSDDNTIKYANESPYYMINRGTIDFISNGSNVLVIPIINKQITSNNFDISLYDTSNYFDFFYLNLLYILFDLYLLDGNMRISYNIISNKNNISFFQNDGIYSFDKCYRTLVTEYFYLILRGKNVHENDNIVSLKYSAISDITNVKLTYDKLLEYYIYSSFDGNNYDLFNIPKNYKIKTIKNNHKYSENYAIIFSIKNSFNDKNFKHLIDLTNYNNKFLSYSKNNTSNTTLQKSFLINANISNEFSFYGNIIVTNYDYAHISNSVILNSNIYNSNFYIQTNTGNLQINMNDIANIKKNIMYYYLNEIRNSNVITKTNYFDGNVSIKELSINNLNYNNNLISHIHIHPDLHTFSIQQYTESDSTFSPSNISSLMLWLDGNDTTSMYSDISESMQVSNIGDKVAVWKNKALNGSNIIISNSDDSVTPIWNNSVYFNGTTYLNANITLSAISSIYIVTDVPSQGGFYLHFSNGTNENTGPAIWTDGKFGDFVYNDYSFNIEEIFGLKQSNKNIYSIDRNNGSYIYGYMNGFKNFTNYNSNSNQSNTILSSFPGYPPYGLPW
jgi:hypothetical protein